MRLKKYAVRGAALALLLVVVCIFALKVGNQEARAAVTLLYFKGQHNGDSVMLEWATATELNTAYFFLERATAKSGPYQTLDQIGLVPSDAPPDGLSGAVYQRVDQDQVLSGQTYWYVLVEVESSQGAESRTEPISVAFSNVQSSPTATATRTSTPLPTSTAVAIGSTPTSTAQAISGPTATGSAPTATAVASGRFSTRTSTSSDSSVPQQDNFAESSVADASAPPQLLSQATSASGDDGYPAPDGNEIPPAQVEPTQESYPGLPPTPQVVATNPYPAAPVGPRGLTNGAPIPNIGTGTQTTAEAPGAEQESSTDSSLLGTLFLWIGFGAAMLVFISAVTGAIYYYNRQRASSR